MNAAPPETAGLRHPQAPSLLDHIGLLGPWGFAILFAVFFVSPLLLVFSLVHTLSGSVQGFANAEGATLGRDFIAFYSAGSLALNGDAAGVYDHAALHAVQQQVIGAPVKHFAWFYPPFTVAFVTPLGLMPYPAALAFWLLVPLIALLVVVWRYFGSAWASGAILVFPGIAQSMLAGQNGVLSALIIAGGLLNLERRPVAAGAILGLLSYKPHVALAVYAALLVGRHWQALVTAAAVTLALTAASLIALGPDPWLAFLRETGVAKSFMEEGRLRWTFMATTFASARLAGLDVSLAYALQAAVACGAFLALFVVWRRDDVALEARAAVLVTVIALVSPYAFGYDLAILGIALLWLLRIGF